MLQKTPGLLEDDFLGDMKGLLGSLLEVFLPLPFRALPWLRDLASPGCCGLCLPLTSSLVLSLTPSGYFQSAPSHCLIYFHVRNMISESPTSFFLVPQWTGLNTGCQGITLYQLQDVN